jgi:hypothetical protein
MIKSILKLWFTHNYSYDQEHYKVMVYAYLKLWIRAFQGYDYRAFQRLWFLHEYSFELKDDLKFAHDYSYESDSYSFKAKYSYSRAYRITESVHVQ